MTSTPKVCSGESTAGVVEDDDLIPSSQSTESQLATAPSMHEGVCQEESNTKLCSGEPTGTMDYDDFVPSSQSADCSPLPSSLTVHDEGCESPVTSLLKRKIDSDGESSKTSSKIARIEVPEDKFSDSNKKLEGTETLIRELTCTLTKNSPTNIISEKEVESVSPSKIKKMCLEPTLSSVKGNVVCVDIVSPNKEVESRLEPPSPSVKGNTVCEDIASSNKDEKTRLEPPSLSVKGNIVLEDTKTIDRLIKSSKKAVVNETMLVLKEKDITNDNKLLSKENEVITKSCKAPADKITLGDTTTNLKVLPGVGRKSLEVVFESVLHTPNASEESQGLHPIIEVEDDQGLDDTVKIVNESQDDDSFHLHLSPISNHLDFSPKKKADQIISDSQSSVTETPGSTKLTKLKSSSSDVSFNSHTQSWSKASSEEKTTSTWNSHSVSSKIDTDVTTIEDDDDDDDDDVEILQSQSVTKSSKTKVSNSQSSNGISTEDGKSLTTDDVMIIDDQNEPGKDTQFSFNKKEILTPEGLTPVSDSCNIFTRVKEVANIKPGGTFLQPSFADSQGTFVKRKQRHENARDEEIIVLPCNDSDDIAVSPTVLKPDGSKILQIPNVVNNQEGNTPDTLPLLVKDQSPENCVNDKIVEMEGELYFKCSAKWRYSETTQQLVSWELMQWGDIDDHVLQSKKRQSEGSSSGVLGDVSGLSKSSSPSSTVSFGPFQFDPQRSSLISTSSSSSAGTAVSCTAHTAVRSGQGDSAIFVRPKYLPSTHSQSFPLASKEAISREKMTFSHNSDKIISLIKGAELISSIERQCYQNSSNRNDGRLAILNSSEPRSESCHLSLNDTQEVTKIQPQQQKERRGSRKALEANSKQEENVVTEGADTPKSTKKSHARSSRATRNTNRGSAAKSAANSKKEEHKVTTTQSRGSATHSTKEVIDAKPVTASKKEESKITMTQQGRTRRVRGDKGDSDTDASQMTDKMQILLAKKSLLELDAPAFARWTDRKYYSCTVKEKLKDDRWVVLFDDNRTKVLKEEYIIPVNIISKGQVVFALVGEDYEEGIITQFEVKDEVVLYGVNIQGENTVYVPRSNLFMTDDQATILQEACLSKLAPNTPKSPAVSLDNVVTGKRSRTMSRCLFNTIEKPGVSGIAKLTPKKRDTSGSSSDIGSSVSILEDIVGVDPESHTVSETYFTTKIRGKGPGKGKGKGRNTSRRNTSANQSMNEADDPEMIEKLGPIPSKGSTMFNGLHFLITHTGVKRTIPKRDGTKSDMELNDSDVDLQRELENQPIFDKDHLISQLEAGGGKVYDHFEDIPKECYSTCYLITDHPNETAKYIQCLAHGIRPVRHNWIIQCLKSKSVGVKRVDSFCLPVGYFRQGQCYLPWSGDTRKQKPLHNKKIAVVNDSKRFLQFWAQILETLGAEVREITPDEVAELSPKLKVIVSDSSCPPGIRDRAQQWSIPLVSTEWVKQCLITKESQPYDGHPFYRYDYIPD